MAEQAGGGTGEQVTNPAAGARQFRAFVDAAPAGVVRSHALGRRWGPARGHNGPLPGAG